jgi:DNA-binding NarL/FixJ family response regulator
VTGEQPEEPSLVGIIGGSRLLRVSLSLLLESKGWKTCEWPWPAPGEESEILTAPLTVAVVDLVGATRQDRNIVSLLADSNCLALVIVPNDSAPMLGRCIEMGATAAVSIGESFEELVDVLRATTKGVGQWTPSERDRLVNEWRVVRDDRDALLRRFQSLSRREAEVLAYLVDGRSADRIARAEVVSEATVRSHIKALLRKLGVNSQLEAVALAARADWRQLADDR